MNGKDDRIQNTEFRGQSLHSGIQVQRGTRMRRMQLIRRIAPGVDNSHLQEQQQSVLFPREESCRLENNPPDPLNSRNPRPPFEPGCRSGSQYWLPEIFLNSEFCILNSVIFAVTHPS